MEKHLLVLLLCNALWQGCSAHRAERGCGYDALAAITFPSVEFNDATLCDAVQFMADEGERQRRDDFEWRPHFVVQVHTAVIEVQPSARGGGSLPDYDFDPITNPRFSLRIAEEITLRELLDEVCGATGFQWKAESRSVRIFRSPQQDERN